MTPILAHLVTAEEAGWALLGRWSWDDPTLIIPLSLGALYTIGLCKWPKPRPLKPWQPYSFYAGLVIGVIAVSSPIDVVSDDLFLMHMVQHLLIVMVAPPLVLLGAPTTPILRGLPSWVKRGVVAPLMRNVGIRSFYGWITFPFVVWLAFTVNMWAWHFYSGAYELAMRNTATHIFQHWTFVATATLFWWTIIDPRPLKSRIPYPLRIFFIGATMMQNVLLGAGITFQDEVLYPFYQNRGQLWGIAPLDDQQTGGLIMWIVGTMMLVAALIAVLVIWLREEDEKGNRQGGSSARAMNPKVAVRGRPPL